MEKYIAFENITQTHLLVLTEYAKKRQDLPTQARNCQLTLNDYKRILDDALYLAGELSFFDPKGKTRKGLEHFFERWYGEGHQWVPEPELKKETPTEPLPFPRILACNAPQLHDPELSPRQMECLRQYITQHNIVRAAEAMKLNKGKYKNELARALYRAAVVCKRRNPMGIMSHPKSTLVCLVHEYFETLENTPAVTMDDPMF